MNLIHIMLARTSIYILIVKKYSMFFCCFY